MFRPAAYKTATTVLDRELFTRTFPLSAIRVPNKQHIAKYRHQLLKSREVLELPSVSAVCNDPDPELAAAGRKCIILRPGINQDGEDSRAAGIHPQLTRKYTDPKTWSSVLQEAVQTEEVGLIPFELTLKYKHWTYRKCMDIGPGTQLTCTQTKSWKQ